MEFLTRTVERYGRWVTEHAEMDGLRREQCLCLNCAVIKDCEVAAAGYELCKAHGIAYAMTRCPLFVGKDDD